LKQQIFFRADASAQIGYGHFFRTLALADMLKEDFDCVFYTVDPTPYQIKELQKVCPYVSLSDTTKFEDFLSRLSGAETVVLDNYFYTSEYQKQIKDKGCKLVCIDDMHDKHYYADIVINHALGSHIEDYSVEPYTQLSLGLSYSLLRKPFLESNYNKNRKNILICFGGADIYNLTCRILQILKEELQTYTVDVVVGDSFKSGEELDEIRKNENNVIVHKSISASEMSSLMQNAQIAFLPASSVLWEAIFSGCKVIYGYYVDNQTDICKNVGSSEKLCLNYVGDLRSVSGSVLKAVFKKEISDGRSPRFIKPDVKSNFEQLFSQSITVREASRDDAELYFKWANDPVVRQMAFHTEPIQWENHLTWFNKKLDDTESILLLCYQNSEAVGQVRFDLNDNGEMEIDISIAKEHRGRGIGKAMLNVALAYVKNMKGYRAFVSEVKIDNYPSQRMFLANGFQIIAQNNGIIHFKKEI
jgi:UDP-2,4-diacetamido-2,4,6-trideoxy-beta-L-altropyranose hydrolase